jgi:KUP system potassium uptake protein
MSVQGLPVSSPPGVPRPAGSHPPNEAAPEKASHGDSTRTLAIAALGVVFGDIGTSPLYAIRECVDKEHGVLPTRANILGVLSLVLWSLVMVVGVKYLGFIMKADNRGEGGILALLALAPDKRKGGSLRIGWMTALVIFGAALLYGDGVITPAISVLSAVEGLTVATTAFQAWVIPLTCVILFGLFSVQRKGTAGIGRVFGPIMGVWFLTLAVSGIVQIARSPSIFEAISPVHAVRFFHEHGWHGVLVLGAVVLVITGGEALYADMGHFGRVPIRLAWFAVVMPALLLNYFGQGALLIANPAISGNPFFAMVPSALVYPLVILSTMATIIASQALISGSYSLTRQAIQLGFFPRVTIVHTSGHAEGQIYIPEINTALAVACIWLVLSFKESSALAAAYGIAVTGTMGITSIIYFVVLTRTWNWPLWRAIPLVGLFLLFDLSFFGANILKFFHGGWFPVAVAIAIYTLMTTWKAGRKVLASNIAGRMLPIDAFLIDVDQHKPHRVRGTAVFMAANPNGVPIVLLHHYKHNQVLHETVVLLSVASENVPEIAPQNRLKVNDLGRGFFQVTAYYGFMETPRVPAVLREAALRYKIPYTPETVSYYLGRETLLPTGRSKMWRWRKTLFSFISRNARSATQYFGIPPDRVVELGMQIDL